MLLATAMLVLLTLLLSGAYAGLALMCQIGVLPAMRKLSPPAFAESWRAMDSYLDRSMPPYKLSLLLVTLAALVCLLALHRPALSVCAGISFLCSLVGLVLTIRKQLPLNRELKQLTANAAPDRLSQIREQTGHNFSVRFVFAVVAFLSVAVGIVFWPLASPLAY